MSKQKKRKLIFDWPIINGSVSTAYAKCGQKNCRCHSDPEAMHGPYYRWIGNIDGKKTTRTIDSKLAKDCQEWMKNHEKLQEKVAQLIEETIDSPVWRKTSKK